MKITMIAAIALLSASAFADVYKIDTAKSVVEWKAGKKVGSFHNGTVKVKGGSVETDKKGAVKSADVVVDMKTIVSDDLKDSPDYKKKLEGHLSSDDFFKVDKFPESTFKLTSVTPKAGSKDEFTVKGDLTMIGKTEAIEFPAKISSDKKSISGKATVVIERLKWNLQYGSGSIFKSLTADKIINDTFELTLNIVANK